MQLKTPLLAISLCAMAVPLHAQNWEGWHAGLQFGGISAEGQHNITEDGFENFDLDAPTKLDEIEGGLVGIRAGRDWMRGSLVFGAEAEISKAGNGVNQFSAVNDTSDNVGEFYETEISGLGSIRGRVGYLVGAEQNTLLYGLAGLAAADIRASNGDADDADPDPGTIDLVADCDTATGACAEASDTVFGYTIGFGVEHQLPDVQFGGGNLSVGLEYAYYDYGDAELSTTTTEANPADHEFDVDLSAHTLQAVLRLRF
ncbi:outer membrane beta-barrel protein [Yoonia sp. GPGPB17]|uniref:outer membrane protein n=1 Tax=Yoonia sp. GPGPB17 TaxID=3026147 RepID=UPI0030BB880B